jgi:hypothetical protein
LYRGGENTLPPEGERGGVHSVGATDRENPVNPVNPVNGVANTGADLLSDDAALICASYGCPNIVPMPGLECDDCLSRPTVPGAFR